MQLKRWMLIGSTATALVLSGCDSSTDQRDHTNTTAAVGSAPQAIAIAATKLKAANQLTIAFTSDISRTGQTERLSGAFNYLTSESSQTITTAGGNTPEVQNNRPVRAIATGKLLYILFPPAMREGASTPWLSFTAAQYNEALGQNAGLEAVKSPFAYGAVGFRDQFAQYLINGDATFAAAGKVTDHGVTYYAYRGYTGPITLTLTTRNHQTIRETYTRLGLTVWLDGTGRVHLVAARSVAKDESTITERFTVRSYTATKPVAPPAAEVTSFGSLPKTTN